MRAITFLAILGLGFTANFLSKEQVADIVFLDVDVGDLLTDGSNAVSAAVNGNVSGAVSDAAEAATDIIGEHQLGVDGVQTVKDIADGASGTKLAEDGVDMVSDLTNYEEIVHDGLQTVDDITSGKSLGKTLEDGATVVGDLVGQGQTVSDGFKAINDITSGKASASTLIQDGVSLAGDVTGNQDLANDINGGISAVSTLAGNSNNEELFDLSGILIGESGEDDSWGQLGTLEYFF